MKMAKLRKVTMKILYTLFIILVHCMRCKQSKTFMLRSVVYAV